MADHESDLGPDAPPTEDELREARALEEALEGDRSHATPSNADAAFLRAVALADSPRELAADAHERLIERALKSAEPRHSRARVVRLFVGGATAFALAAGVLLAITTAEREAPTTASVAPLAQSRSTQDLFREPFRASDPSARIDRIAMARAGDLRENRFARWGVR